MSEHGNVTVPESVETVLRMRAESLATEAEQAEDTDLISLLLFRLGHEWYAVAIDSVREIFQDYELTPLPCVPSFVLGVVNVRGEILSVTDPAMAMGIGKVELTGDEPPPAIVLSRDDVATAVVVDEIGDIAESPSAAIEPPVSIIDRKQAEFISGSVHLGEAMYGIVHVERLLEPVTTGRT